MPHPENSRHPSAPNHPPRRPDQPKHHSTSHHLWNSGPRPHPPYHHRTSQPRQPEQHREVARVRYDADDEVRDGTWVAELTALLDLASWPAGMRVIVRRNDPTPAPAALRGRRRDADHRARHQRHPRTTRRPRAALLPISKSRPIRKQPIDLDRTSSPNLAPPTIRRAATLLTAANHQNRTPVTPLVATVSYQAFAIARHLDPFHHSKREPEPWHKTAHANALNRPPGH